MRYLLALAALLMLGATACKKSQTTQPGTIEMTPIHTPGDNAFSFNCVTIARFPCIANSIQNSVQHTGNTFTIRFFGVSPVPSCGTVTGTAFCQVTLGQLPNGDHNLIIDNNGAITNATLTVTDQRYTLSFDTLHNIGFTKQVLMRIPNVTIWGQLTYASPQQAVVRDSFLQLLTGMGALPFTGATGDYGDFVLNTDSTLTISNLQATKQFTFTRSFIYHYTGIIDSLRPFVEKYGSAHDSVATFQVFASDGSMVSWPPPPLVLLQ